jgi:hypothetical protein
LESGQAPKNKGKTPKTGGSTGEYLYSFGAFAFCPFLEPTRGPLNCLHGLAQLPGLAVQRLMADGYGFGAEGDWKTAALVRAMKVMAAGLDGGTSFMQVFPIWRVWSSC